MKPNKSSGLWAVADGGIPIPAAVLADSHCHLDAAEFDSDRDRVMDRARRAGIGLIVVPAVARANFAAVASVCRDYPECRPAFGIHPMYVDRARDEDLTVLRRILQEEPAVAVGEIGLDFFITPRDEARQRYFFEAQLAIAAELDLPVLLHVRRAVDPILGMLRRYRVRSGIAHAFNGSLQQAEALIALGFKLGFGGTLTDPRAMRIRRLAAALPVTSLVLETDAPDLPPQWLDHGRNEPAELARIAGVLAELRGCGPEAIAMTTRANLDALLVARRPAAESAT